MEWLMNHACRLEEENTTLKQNINSLMALIESQASELGQAWNAAGIWRLKANAPEPVLRGLRVAIIGPSFRQHDYKSIAESLDGRFYFAPSDEKLSQIDRVVQRADIVLFMTGYAGHDASLRARAAATRNNVEITFQDSTSVSSLESWLRTKAMAQ